MESEFEKICVQRIDRGSKYKQEIPEGATHFDLEIDTSDCYYQGDEPDYLIHFFKEKNRGA